ncbi:MAG: lytic transglycosylase domain-containing protein [Leptothrix ochracea]|uniref:lytic transglycosylase domain-containing protein n=1 Tax=Leptothrix ochracea TaxID=735331 RepID=UPI0034E26327
MALLGVGVFTVALIVFGRSDLGTEFEAEALTWLQQRQAARTLADAGSSTELNALDASWGDLNAVDRATAADPAKLSRQQASVAKWLSHRYRVAPEPVSRLVQEAWRMGHREKLEPTLILAVMAIESGFNPFAQSAVGAQGLMQVMTRVHDAKYEVFGGNHAAFDPVTNLRVGVQVLKECITRAGGSLEGGLRRYVGATNLTDDGGYANKVLAEHKYLHQIAQGLSVPVTAHLPSPTVAPEAPATGQRNTRLALR